MYHVVNVARLSPTVQCRECLLTDTVTEVTGSLTANLCSVRAGHVS